MKTYEEKTERDKIRVVLSILGLDGHDFALKYISHLLKDGGMEVIYLGCFQTVESTINTAVQEDADVIGLSCHSWEYLHYVPQLIDAISRRKMSIPVVVGGGIFTESDESQLKGMGIAAVFRGGTTAEDIIGGIKRAVKSQEGLREKIRNEQPLFGFRTEFKSKSDW